MSVRGGLHAGLWVLLIILCCFSLRLGKRVDAPDESPGIGGAWNLVRQPTLPDPALHRPRPPVHDDDPPALNASSHHADAHVAMQR